MSELPNKISQQIISLGHNIIYSSVCRENFNSIFKKKSYVVINEYGIDVFSFKTLQYLGSLMWINIKNIKQVENQVCLEYLSKNVVFQPDEGINQLYGAILHAIFQILLPYELKGIGIENIKIPRVINSDLGAYIRISLLTMNENVIISPNTLEKFKKNLVFSIESLNSWDFEDSESLIPILFSSLPLCSAIKSIFLRKFKNESVFRYLSQFSSYLSRLQFIDIDSPVDTDFNDFIKVFSANKSKRLTGISFSNCQFSSENLVSITNLVSQSKIHSIGFHKAILNDAMPFFYNSFFTSNATSNICVLSLDGTRNISLVKLMPSIKHINVLSLENCELQVDHIIANISSNGLNDLRSLNISSNSCDHLAYSALSIPSRLVSIVAANIKWSDYCLRNFLILVFSQAKGNLKLSLSNSHASEIEWGRVFVEFSKSQFVLLNSLFWDSNPLHASLFQFLSRNKEFEYLSMNECFTYTIPTSISALVWFLERSESLKFLVLRGSKIKFIGNLISSIIKVVMTKTALIHFDISFNSIGDEGLKVLELLYPKPSNLKVIDFDGSKPSSYTSLSNLLFQAIEHPNICTSFPKIDIEDLHISGKISDCEKSSLYQKFGKHTKIEDITDPNYPTPATSPYFSPFHVFINSFSSKFPQYLDECAISELKMLPDKPFISTKVPQVFIGNRKHADTLKPFKKPMIQSVDLFEIDQLPIIPENSIEKPALIQEVAPPPHEIVPENQEDQRTPKKKTKKRRRTSVKSPFVPQIPRPLRDDFDTLIVTRNEMEELPKPPTPKQIIIPPPFLPPKPIALPKKRTLFIDPSDTMTDEMVHSPIQMKKENNFRYLDTFDEEQNDLGTYPRLIRLKNH